MLVRMYVQYVCTVCTVCTYVRMYSMCMYSMYSIYVQFACADVQYDARVTSWSVPLVTLQQVYVHVCTSKLPVL